MMLDNVIQQFAGGGHESMDDSQLHGGVAQMLQSAPNEHGVGAIGEALSSLGGGGFGQSVQQGSVNAEPAQREGLAETLMSAVSQGGGSPSAVRSQLGLGHSSSVSPEQLGALAQYTGENHPNALSQVMGNQLGGGGSSGGMMSLLGNPMVRQVGISLAKRIL